jgi:hypothetical protein
MRGRAPTQGRLTGNEGMLIACAWPRNAYCCYVVQTLALLPLNVAITAVSKHVFKIEKCRTGKRPEVAYPNIPALTQEHVLPIVHDGPVYMPLPGDGDTSTSDV